MKQEDYKKVFCTEKAPDVETLIASIPDPADTNLGHFSDRSLASITQAFAVSGWDFDSVLLPWLNVSETKDRWVDVNVLDAEPGVIIYRKGTGIRLVFVVGEAPSGGLNVRALSKAFHYALSLATKTSSEVALLGPSFSGSVRSLIRTVEEMADENTEFRVQAYSGTVTGVNAMKDLPRITFHSVVETNAVSFRWLVQTAKALNIPDEKVAIVGEADTAFGAEYTYRGSKTLLPFRKISFPKDISDLRNNYKESTSGKIPSGVEQSGLTLSYHDSATAGDSFPLLARPVTTQSQYAVLRAIIEDLGATRN